MQHLSHASYYIGSAHSESGLPVQDRACARCVTLCDGRTGTLMALSDGHGGAVHCRSDIGAEIAVETALELLPGFIESICSRMSLAQDSVGRGVVTDELSPEEDRTEVDSLFESDFRAFFSRLNSRWSAGIFKHMEEYPLDPPLPIPARAYGCTLIGAAVFDDFWLTFQLGDGAVVGIGENGCPLNPIPSDSRCHSNITTSMCMNGPADFRYAYGVKVPLALMICSDGVEDSFDSHETLATGLLAPIVDEISSAGMDAVERDLADILPRLSCDVSHDDMSIALWTTLENARAIAPSLRAISYTCHTGDLQRASLELEECMRHIDSLQCDIASLAFDSDDDAAANIVRKESVLATLRRRASELKDEIEHISNVLNNIYNA